MTWKLLPAAALAALSGCATQPIHVAHVVAPPAPTRSIPSPIQPPRSGAQMRAAMAATANNPSLGGAAMLGNRTIADNCASAPNLRTMVRVLDAGGAKAMLASRGPFTVFAPTDQAFERLSSGAVDELLAPANRPTLTKVASYHIVPGAITLDELRSRIHAGKGIAILITVVGSPLTVTQEGAAVAITDGNGHKSYVETADVQQTNGIIHAVNGVLVPQLG